LSNGISVVLVTSLPPLLRSLEITGSLLSDMPSDLYHTASTFYACLLGMASDSSSPDVKARHAKQKSVLFNCAGLMIHISAVIYPIARNVKKCKPVHIISSSTIR